MGVTLDILKISGTTPNAIDSLYILVKGTESGPCVEKEWMQWKGVNCLIYKIEVTNQHSVFFHGVCKDLTSRSFSWPNKVRKNDDTPHYIVRVNQVVNGSPCGRKTMCVKSWTIRPYCWRSMYLSTWPWKTGWTLEVHVLGAKRKESPIVVRSELRQLRLDVPDRSSQRT